MTFFTHARVLISRVLDVFVRSRRDARLNDEIETHLDLLTTDLMATGLSPREARAAARRTLGGVDQLKSEYRDQRGLPLLDTFLQDVRFAGRLLTRDRGFATTAVVVLAIGIGVNNMFFTILNAHTIRGLPIAEASRIVYISTFDDRNRDRGVSFPEFLDLREGAESLAAVSAFSTAPAIVAGDGFAADRLTATFLSSNAFDLLGIDAQFGRGLIPDDDATGSTPVVLLGNAVWQARYGGDPRVLGRAILVNGTLSTIVGVVPDRSGFPTTADIWLPLRLAPGFAAGNRDMRNLRALARLGDGVPLTKAAAEVDIIIGRSIQSNPKADQKMRARATPVDQQFFGRLTDPAWKAFIAAGFLVVLISCANVANLMLAHSIGRAREFAIRTSLGASRRRILRQLLIEGVVLAGAGAVVGFGVSLASVRLFRSAIPANALPYWMDYSVDARVIAALVLVALCTVFLFALLPALQASKADVNAILKEGGRPAGGRGSRWPTVFLTAEFALAVVLLSQTVANVRDASPPLPSDRAIDTRDVITAALTLPAPKMSTEERIQRYESVYERIRTLPGVTSVSMANALPLMGGAEVALKAVGTRHSTTDAIGNVRTVLIAPGYFRTIGIDLLHGRELTADDGTAASPVCIVNERFAAKFFPGISPLGQQIALTADSAAVAAEPVAIIGVAADIRQRPSRDPEPLVYVPYKTAPPVTLSVLLRINTDPARVVPLLRNAILTVDPSMPVYRIQAMSEVVRDADWNRRLSYVLVMFVTFVAVGLSTVGLYAVTAHGVSRRSQEIGVRMALGARSSAVLLIVVRRILIQLSLGFIAGILCTIAWQRMFGSANTGEKAFAAVSLAQVAATLLVVAAVACFVPARRALRLDPVAAIRGD